MKKLLLILAFALSLQASCNSDRIDLVGKYHYFLKSTMNNNKLYQKYALEDILKVYTKMEKSCDSWQAKEIRGIKGYLQGELDNFGNTDPYKNYIKGK